VRVPAWSGSSRSSAVGHPRLFLFDIGVRNALLRRPLDTPLPDERGILLEHFVACELHRRLRTLWPETALFHYRTRSGAEVDFVLEVGRDLWGIEVKAGHRVTRSMLRGLRSLASRSGRVRRRIVVFLGDRPQLMDGVEVMPLADFLAELPGHAEYMRVPHAALHVLHAGGPRPALPGHHVHALPVQVRRRGIGQCSREEVRGATRGCPGDDLDGAAGECGVLVRGGVGHREGWGGGVDRTGHQTPMTAEALAVLDDPRREIRTTQPHAYQVSPRWRESQQEIV